MSGPTLRAAAARARHALRGVTSRVLRVFRALYGESPLHLALLLASFALCGYALDRLLADDWYGVAKWIVGAALLHDLVLVPLYGGADWVLHRLLRLGAPASPRRIAVVNHIRVPAFVSLLLLLVYWPLVSRDVGAARYHNATGRSLDVFRTRWLALTAVLFALSALHLCWRLWRTRPRDAVPATGPEPRPAPQGGVGRAGRAVRWWSGRSVRRVGGRSGR
jgi:hypothetical protein